MTTQTRASLRARLVRLIPVTLLVVVMLLGAIVALRPAAPGASAAVSALPAALPTHFSFGLMDAPGGAANLASMRTANGTAWDYRYQYLSGGANTGTGWETWNSPSGQFATYYMQESADKGIMPAFVYYEMLQSNGPSGGSEQGTDLAHLNSATTMKAYFANWTLLMQKISAFGNPVLVIVEPDLWGNIEQQAIRNGSHSAASVPAAVASSGNADAQGYANNAQGYAYALLHIRDKYAKNAVLAIHSSTWGTMTDIASNTSATLDAASIGGTEAQFLNSAGVKGTPAGVSTWDAVSQDIADHDSGQSGIWWDTSNKTFPNFTRYLQYAKAISDGTGKRILLWQVPEGNQYYATENNSAGHTQDNKAQYILGHVADFANAGIIGVLFGPGNGGTNATDARNDGVTNPAPISTPGCNKCNTHTSQYADDDGGYLRLTLGQYYKNGGYSLTGSSGQATPTPTGTPTVTFGASGVSPSPVVRGAAATVTTTFTASRSATALVDFELYNAAGQRVWQGFTDQVMLTGAQQSLSQSLTLPTSLPAGTYTLQVGVFKAGWGVTYGWNAKAATITVR